MNSVKENDVCRTIIDRNEVLSQKISQNIASELGSEVDNGKLRELLAKIRAET